MQNTIYLQMFYEDVYQSALTSQHMSRGITVDNHLIQWEQTNYILNSKGMIKGFQVGNNLMLPNYMLDDLTKLMLDIKHNRAHARDLIQFTSQLLPMPTLHLNRTWKEHDKLMVIGFNPNLKLQFRGKTIYTPNKEYLTIAEGYFNPVICTEDTLPKRIPVLVVDMSGNEYLQNYHYYWTDKYFNPKEGLHYVQTKR